MEIEKIEAWFDGSCEPFNPGGNGGTGWVIKKDGVFLASGNSHFRASPSISNNVMEYQAVIDVMQWLLNKGLKDAEIKIYGDSQLVIKQLRGEWKSKKGLYLKKYIEAKRIKEQFIDVEFYWIPREKNEEADAESRVAIGEALFPEYQKVMCRQMDIEYKRIVS